MPWGYDYTTPVHRRQNQTPAAQLSPGVVMQSLNDQRGAAGGNTARVMVHALWSPWLISWWLIRWSYVNIDNG